MMTTRHLRGIGASISVILSALIFLWLVTRDAHTPMPWWFAGAIVGALAAGLAGVVWNLVAARRYRPPEKPWLSRADWAARLIRYRDTAWWKRLLGSLAICAMSGPIVFAAVCAPERMEMTGVGARVAMAALGGMFFAGALFMIARQIVDWAVGRKRDECECRLLTLPGAIGGWFKADVAIPDQRYEGPLTVRLTNIRRITDSDPPSMDVYWSDSYAVSAAALPLEAGGRRLVPVRFRVPATGRSTTVDDRKDRVAWELELEAPVRGSDLHAGFDVPVFATPAVDPDEQQNEPSPALTLAEPETTLSFPPAGVRVHWLPEGIRLDYGRRQPARALLLLPLSAMFGGAAHALHYEQQAPVPITGFFAFAALFCFSGAVKLLLHRWAVQAGRDGLVVMRGRGFFGRRRLARPAIDDLAILHHDPDTNLATPGRTHVVAAGYRVRGKRRVLKISPPFTKRSEAEWLLAEVQRALGEAPR